MSPQRSTGLRAGRHADAIVRAARTGRALLGETHGTIFGPSDCEAAYARASRRRWRVMRAAPWQALSDQLRFANGRIQEAAIHFNAKSERLQEEHIGVSTEDEAWAKAEAEGRTVEVGVGPQDETWTKAEAADGPSKFASVPKKRDR